MDKGEDPRRESMPEHRKSRLMTHMECEHELVMPDEYFKDTIRLQLRSLFEENALKDTTITLRFLPGISWSKVVLLILTQHRANIITVNSFILSLLSPVLRKMICGNFRESVQKEIGLDDVDAERLLKLLQLGCGKKEFVALDIGELLELGELADRLQMEAVRSEIEDKISKELTVGNCLEMIQWCEGRGLELLQKECYKMLRDEFEAISQKEGFVDVSEATMEALLEEDELGAGREEDVFEAVERWMSCSDERMCENGLLRKIRYGLMKNEHLAGLMSSPSHGTVKDLVGETMAKKGGSCGERMWDGVERLCDKWIVARGMKGRVLGADVLKSPACVAMDGQGRIVVSDLDLHEVIVFNHDGSVERRFGSRGAAPGQFDKPLGVAVDGQGHIIVADSGNHRIEVMNADGTVARCFGSKGSAVGELKWPCGVAIDREGHIVVVDRGNHRIQVFDVEGSVVRDFGSKGAAIGQLDSPTGVAVDGAGRIVVVDEGNHRVQVFNGGGSVALCFGSEGSGPGQLQHPWGVVLDSAGKVVVTDAGNGRVQVFNPDGSVERVVGSAGDWLGELRHPFGVVVDGAGRMIVAGGVGNRVQVF